MVLWLSAALSVIAFALASSVREAAYGAETALESSRAWLLGRGAVERTLMFLSAPPIEEPGIQPPYRPGQMRMFWAFPSGAVMVEIRPESGKLNLNSAPPDLMLAVLAAARYPPEQARQLVAAIVAWRTPPSAGTPLDYSYFLTPSAFRMAGASFQRVEDLFQVPGVNAQIYFGGLERQGSETVRRPGLRDLFSVAGGVGVYNANSVHPAILAAHGASPAEIGLLMELRRAGQILPETLAPITMAGLPANRLLQVGFEMSLTVAATARPVRPAGGLAALRRTVTALVRMETPAPGYPPVPVIERWDDSGGTDLPWPGERIGAPAAEERR
jgi:general secretion pathway protein K